MKTIVTVAAVVMLLGTGVSPAAGQEWEYSTTVGTGSITGIGGADSGEAWAVMGGYTTQGKVFYFNGSSWSVETAIYPANNGEHRGLCMGPTGDWGYLVGNSNTPRGAIFRYQRPYWSLQTSLVGGSSYLYSAYSPDEYHVWVGGSAGNLYYSADTGATWTIQTNFGPGIFVRALAGSNPNDVWAVAGLTDPYADNSIYHYDGTYWSVQTTIALKLSDISTSDEGRAWVGAYDGVILRYAENNWSVFTDVGNPTINSIAAADNDKAWAGLSNGAILYFDGGDWSVETLTPSSQGIDEVRVSPAGEIWAGAHYGVIYRCGIRPPLRWIYDFNGDGTSDITVFRESSGLWAVRGVTRSYFGTSGDTPVPGDFDGDGTTEIAVYRPGTGLWAVRGQTRVYFGTHLDRPLPADFAGDGTAAVAIFRAASGLWAVRGLTRAYFGTSSDFPVPGDYTAEGNADIAVFRPGNGLWAARGFSRAYFGQSGDTPVPAAYGGGGAEPGIFRPSSGLWALMGRTRFYFGQSADSPLPFHYQGYNSARPSVFRPATGLWAIRGHTRIYFGGSGDIPLAR